MLFHACLIDQFRRLSEVVGKAKSSDPPGYESNANYKLFSALSRLMLETVPQDPGKDEYRQGTTMGPRWKHWLRAKVGRRFRLFYRYDSSSKIIVYAWVNDTRSLRKAGSTTDPFKVFKRSLERGNPPDSWQELLASSASEPDLG